MLHYVAVVYRAVLCCAVLCCVPPVGRGEGGVADASRTGQVGSSAQGAYVFRNFFAFTFSTLVDTLEAFKCTLRHLSG